MVSKNNTRLYDEKMNKNKFKYSIRKLNVGVASVLIGVTFGLGALAATASADEVNQAQTTELSTPVKASATEEGETTSVVNTQAQQEETTASNAEAQTTTFNVADFVQDNAVSADMLAESKAVTTDDAEDSAAVPTENQTNSHQSYTTPDRSKTSPLYSGDGIRFVKLVDEGYKIGWTRQQLASRPNDPGFILSDDGKTLVYRLSAGDTTPASSNDILSLIYAYPDPYPENNPKQVMWGDDKRLAEDRKDDPANKTQWNYKGFGYYANNQRAFILDLVDQKSQGDFKVDLSPNNYVGKSVSDQLVIPSDNISRSNPYPGVTIKDDEENVNYYSGDKLVKGYLIGTNQVANRMGKPQDYWGTQTIRFVMAPVNAAPIIKVPETAAKMGASLYEDAHTKTSYYSLADEAAANNIIADNVVAVDYMDDYSHTSLKKLLKIVDQNGDEVTEQMHPNTLYTVQMTATDSGNLKSSEKFNIVIGHLLSSSDVNKTGLKNLITEGDELSKAGKVTADDRTEVPVDPADKEALDKALKAGNAVYNNSSASQADVDAAKKAIDDAMKNIKNKANQASAQPTDVQAVKDAQGTTVTGKATPESTVEVKDQDGNVLGTAKADE
ncbi:YSIRK-type signal peptide-containing protein, partial [Ligilactobacillus equi]|uniref:YSIRK-type signal peptide-containing protein n=1 Tax=Ligilactobacillus equi TaxID=137357 RepID=UPI002ED571E4